MDSRKLRRKLRRKIKKISKKVLKKIIFENSKKSTSFTTLYTSEVTTMNPDDNNSLHYLYNIIPTTSTSVYTIYNDKNDYFNYEISTRVVDTIIEVSKTSLLTLNLPTPTKNMEGFVIMLIFPGTKYGEGIISIQSTPPIVAQNIKSLISSVSHMSFAFRYHIQYICDGKVWIETSFV
jgi:hypothetical protein